MAGIVKDNTTEVTSKSAMLLNSNTQFLSVIATTPDKLKDLVIKDGQLIFMHNVGRIAFDLDGKRQFYNQVIELQTDVERESLSNAVNGKYYFVIDTAVFWRYSNGWIQLTKNPDEILFVGTELPELGKSNTLYVNKTEKEISVWDDEEKKFIQVSNYTHEITDEDIEKLFN